MYRHIILMLIIPVVLLGMLSTCNKASIEHLSEGKITTTNNDEDSTAINEIILPVEEMPQIIGGTQAITKMISYPADAIEKGIEGIIIVSMTIGTDGKAHNIKIHKGLCDTCDLEVIKAVQNARFDLGSVNPQGHNPIEKNLSFPVHFELPDCVYIRRTDTNCN